MGMCNSVSMLRQAEDPGALNAGSTSYLSEEREVVLEPRWLFKSESTSKELELSASNESHLIERADWATLMSTSVFPNFMPTMVLRKGSNFGLSFILPSI